MYRKETIFWPFCLWCFDCGAVALGVPFGVLDGRCTVTVSSPDYCLPFYLKISARS